MRTRHFAAAVHNLSLSQHYLNLKRNVLGALRRAEVALARNFGRALGVTLIVSLLATSAPTAAPTLMTFVKESERVAVSRSFDSKVFSALRRGLAYSSGKYWSLANKLASKTTIKHEIVPQYAAIAAAMSPAPPVIDAPTNMAVTATANNSISLSWTAPAGTVNNYQVERSQSPSGPFSVIGAPTTTTFNDTTVSSGSAYLYRVRAVSGGIPSLPSNMAVGTAITFTDNPLSVGVTTIKAVHITEVRQSVNAVRSVAGLSAASWTDASLPGIFVKAVHVQEMRDKLGEALSALSVPATAYTDPVLSTGASGTPVKKVHIEELRQRASRSSSTSSGSSSGDSSVARLDPLNRTGGAGEDPLSRNFNFNVPLVGLSGRAGLDLGLSLSYNSLVWTRSGSFISFDDDRGFPSPGFRLGFPVIQSQYFNSEVGKWAYLLITPTGSRVELRQVGTSALYESADSSHMLLDTSTNPIILRTTDGTQLSYVWLGSDFQCTQIKDRNGNFITISYTAFGRIDTIIDTLSRSIKFNYDGSQYLSSITQTWTVNGSPVTHTWASFTYSTPNLTIQTNFPGLTVIGPSNGSTVKVLTRVTLTDNSGLDFDYTSWGQVWKVRNFATDGHLLNYRSYNLPQNNSIAHSDCPRFTERRQWAENWNRGGPNGVANLPVGGEQEVLTSYAVPVSASWTMPDNSQQTGTRTQVTLPDNTYHKIYFEGTAGTSSGWRRGLPSLVETYDSANVRQKQSVTTWTQDNTTVSFQLNPRFTETNVYDLAGNRARTTVDYQTANHPDGTSCQLPKDVLEYQANATTVLRRTHAEYNLNPIYTNRRIIGLVSEKTLYQVDPNTLAETLMSKVGFEYDETGSIQGNHTPVQHDNTNYTASFVAGRANLTSVKRYDVNNSQFVTTSKKYNTAGAIVQTTDPANHQETISYTDAFSANGTTLDPALGFSTLAYPTTTTDADGYSSSFRYNYDFGATTWKQTPLPNTTANSPGPQQKITFDSVGRVERVTNLVNNAYTRFIYGPNYVESFASVNNVADEAHSVQVFDGLGRIIGRANNHPGSTGGFSGQLIQYDVMGRAIQQSNPTETSVTISGVIQPYNWAATGDDATPTGNGWVYTQQTYDWIGRPLITTNPSITGNPADTTAKEASYGGCGCAGGEIATLTDEGTIENGVVKRRQQKIYSDVLGREIKTELLNWQGGTVYSTVVSTYNARDQVTSVKQYAGAATIDGSCPSGSCQESTTTYDGHGRLKTRHVPEQNAGANTTWDYNSDDTVQKITDGRGAAQNMSYNSRHLLTGVSYTAPAGITIPGTVSYTYDAVGNRASMSDDSGSTSYQYSDLSQITSETRQFTGLSGTYPLTYEYNLLGALKSITDFTNARINYAYDTANRLSNITGVNYLISQFVTSIGYRAWGGAKQISYGNGRVVSMSYNQRLNVTHFEIPSSMSIDYEYYNDGRLKNSNNLLNPKFDRAYTYDTGARITKSLTGIEAHGQGPTQDRPYRETINYDAFDHIIQRSTSHWSKVPAYGFSHTYTNNRRNGWQYDADGNLTVDSSQQYSYDAAGRMITISGGNIAQFFDGDGERVKTTEPNVVTYYLRSSLLNGQVIAELDGSGNKQLGFVYVGGKVLAEQYQNGAIGFVHEDSSGLSIRKSNAQAGPIIEITELDTFKADVGTGDPYLEDPQWEGRGKVGPMYPGFGDATDASGGCTLDGVFVPCDMAFRLLGQGAAVQCPDNNCLPGVRNLPGIGSVFTGNFQANQTWSGFLPVGVQHVGDGLLVDGEKITPDDFEFGPLFQALASYFIQPNRKKKRRPRRAAPKEPTVGDIDIPTIFRPRPVPAPPPTPSPAPQPGQALTPCNKSRLAPYFPGVNLDKIRIHIGFPSTSLLAGSVLAYVGIQTLNDARAITIGNDIYFRSDSEYNPDSITGIADVGHEIRHAAQQQSGFSFRQYAREYVELRRQGLSDDDAYRFTTSEKEAFRTEDIIKQDLFNLRRQLGGDAFWSPCPPR